MDKEPKPRIGANISRLQAIDDEQAFTQNKCSMKARKVLSDTEKY